jgi:hypothetical protein
MAAERTVGTVKAMSSLAEPRFVFLDVDGPLIPSGPGRSTKGMARAVPQPCRTAMLGDYAGTS